MKRHTTPASVSSITPGDFGIYKAGHIFNNGIPYVIVALNETKDGLVAEGYAMLPKRLLQPPFVYGEMPSQAQAAFDGACRQLLNIRAGMDIMDAALFPAVLNFVDAHRSDLLFMDGYLSPLGKIRELTESEALKKYIDSGMGRYGKAR
jgi:hypothetical protein